MENKSKIKLLVICYYFPPEGGPAVQRISKFVKYLSKLGVKVYVLTSKHPVKIEDNTLLKDLPNSLEVFYVRDYFSYLPGEIRKFFKKKSIPDKHQFWNKRAIKKAEKIIKDNGINIILTTSPPHSVHLIGLELKRKLNIKWVTDFRDEWTADPNFNNSFKSNISVMEKEVVNECDALISVTEKAIQNFSKYDCNVNLITNGYDEDDFAHINSIVPIKNKKLTIVYTGRFTRKSSPYALFKTLSLMIKNDPEIFTYLNFKIFGSLDNKTWIEEYPNLESVVSFYSYVPHDKSILELSNADVLLLLASNTEKSEVFSGKIFEYIYMRKPIFATMNFRGELSGLLNEYGNAYIGITTEENSIKNGIERLLTDWKNKRINRPVNEEFILQFNRKNHSQRLLNILETINSKSINSPENQHV